MKNPTLKIYLLALGILILVIIDTPVEDRIVHLFDDESRLAFQYSENNETDTSIVIVNMELQPLDTIRQWTRRILNLKPRVLAIDNFSGTVENIERINGTIILPIISEDGVSFEYSTNNFTTGQTYGVVLVEDYFKLKKFFYTDSARLPSIATQIIKEYDPVKYAEIIEGNNEEFINYIPTTRFMTIDYPGMYSDEYLERLVKDKIVIIGYLGYNSDHLPSILDTNDSHETPIGTIYGPVIIANEIHTLMEKRIGEPGRLSLTIFSIVLLVGSFLIIARLKTTKGAFIICGLNLLLIILLGSIALISTLLNVTYTIFISIELIGIALLLGFQGGIIYRLTKG